MISRFEHSHPNGLQALAGSLRGLNEQHANRLHVLLLGGEKLADLKYRERELSILNIAEPKPWPEPPPGDAAQLAPNADPSTAADLLARCGGFPPLLHAALRIQREEGHVNDERLSEESCVWELFTSLRLNPAQQAKLHDWLACRDTPIKPLRPYLFDDLLRALYWQGLLAPRERQLYWRCEAMRLAGLEILREMADAGR